ncbi:hypothetical protein FW774_13990 [Pedobacter sp. BS3]|uniref:glycoside hydrolase family 76 protein n=1 Tax=Pedobacter sp. BS3 TaxID=2567937 RepID=UPI0011ECEB82|nr:glycoside hydrolase family 76 protein [Pedobacter sp. BS3]TZF82613.1 hypothetical protein FW774_13990 [Pedobacter sp. BS3]
MKAVKYKHLVVLLCAGFAFYSCKKQNSAETLNLKNTAFVDSIRVLSGKGRVKLTGSLKEYAELGKIKISWGNGNEIVFPAGKTTIDTIIQVGEGITLFTVTSYNKQDEALDESVMIGTSYGDKYRSKLRNRAILMADYSPVSHTTTITWDENKLFYNPVSIEAIYNDTKSISSPATEQSTTLPDYDVAKPIFKYRTIFKPDSTCIDTFATAYTSSEIMNWSKAADSVQLSLNDFYIPSSKSYTQTYKSTNWGGYWPTAHVLDVLIDGYVRTGSAAYKTLMDDLLVGMKQKNGNKWLNNYYDDMEWMALASLRAYKVTNDAKFKSVSDELWLYIKAGISTDMGGGIWENMDKKTKNAPSNGPAAIFAARNYSLFQVTDDLNKAKSIYSWEKATLFSPTEGWVNDHIDLNKVITTWRFTYNQGTFLGAGLELYKLTNESNYLNDAIKAADYTISSLTNNGILKVEGSGGSDAGLFKGIFIRYLTRLIIEGNLPADKKSDYLNFIKTNAETLWLKGRNKTLGTFQNDWTLNTETQTFLTCQLSGIMLIEAMAELRSKDLI